MMYYNDKFNLKVSILNCCDFLKVNNKIKFNEIMKEDSANLFSSTTKIN